MDELSSLLIGVDNRMAATAANSQFYFRKVFSMAAKNKSVQKAMKKKRKKRPKSDSVITIGGGGGRRLVRGKRVDEPVWCEFDHDYYQDNGSGKFENPAWQLGRLVITTPDTKFEIPITKDCVVTARCDEGKERIYIHSNPLAVQFDKTTYPRDSPVSKRHTAKKISKKTSVDIEFKDSRNRIDIKKPLVIEARKR